ncbi:MAG: ABC transporter ATP-binding protein, partial [Actinomycetota bacterium]|nr:ABC transporter ATP-binding protein [Actinomycetota bacterium]
PQVLFGGALLAVPQMNVIGRVISALAPVRWAFEALGHITDLETHFQTDATQLGAGLAVAYEDSFSRNPAEDWVILALFAIVPIVLTCVVLKRRTSSR